jgi:glycosyl transferase family 87
VAYALATCAAVVLLSVLFAEKISRKMPDLQVYWTAAVRARGAEPLYRVDDLHYQFKYLPAFAVLSIPGGLVSLETAKAIWFAISVGLLVALVRLSLALLPERRKPAWALVAVTLVAMLKFFGHELVLGQMNALFAVVVVLALLALVDGRKEATAGALFALAIVVKPYAVIFLPWLLARRRVPSIAAAAAGLVAALALPALVYGIRGDVVLHQAWWRTVSDSTAPNLTNPDNVSVAALFAKWIGIGGPAAVLSAFTGLLLLGAAVFVVVRRRGLASPDGLEGALLLTLIPLLSPQGWDYVFLLSTPAIVFLVNYEDRLPGALRALVIAAIAIVGLSLFDVMGRAAYGAFMALSVVTLCFVVVVAALCHLRARAIA